MGSNFGTVDSAALLRRILGVLGVASLAACAARSVDEGDDEVAEETESESSSSSSSSSSSESESESESSSGSTSTEDTEDTDGETEAESDGPVPDVNQTTDVDESDSTDDGEPVDCSGLDIDDQIQFEPPIECLSPDNRYTLANVCFHPPEGVACETRPFADACIIDGFACGLAEVGEAIGCGPFTTETGACCYVVWGHCPIGRPWIVEGRARRAALGDAGDWASPIALDLAGIDAETRAALADAWASEALSEHASVASFARFTMQLLALGAPSALVEASIRAGLDEVRHARACFALASTYAGSPVGPGPLDVRGGLDEPLDLDSIALSLAAEGCIAETVSAILLAAARDRARHPGVRAALAAIVEDEVEHVLLAWEALAWMCRRGHGLARVAAVFREAEQHVGFGAITELAGSPKLMREHGYLSVDERRAIATRALADVVAPAARELFASLDLVDDRAYPSSAAS
jgi:hypothetical protein